MMTVASLLTIHPEQPPDGRRRSSAFSPFTANHGLPQAHSRY